MSESWLSGLKPGFLALCLQSHLLRSSFCVSVCAQVCVHSCTLYTHTAKNTQTWCLSQGFYSCTNIITKKQVGEERVYSAYISTLLFITERSQEWNSSRSGSRSWCRGHGGIFFTGLLLLACSACSLIKPKTTSPEVVPPTRSLSPLITNWENALQLGGISPTEVPFSVITPAYVKLTPKTSQYNWPLVNLTHKHITSTPQLLVLIHPQDLNNFKSPSLYILKVQSF